MFIQRLERNIWLVGWGGGEGSDEPEGDPSTQLARYFFQISAALTFSWLNILN